MEALAFLSETRILIASTFEVTCRNRCAFHARNVAPRVLLYGHSCNALCIPGPGKLVSVRIENLPLQLITACIWIVFCSN